MLETSISRRQILSGILGLSVISLIPNIIMAKPKQGMSIFKLEFDIQLLTFKTDKKIWDYYWCKKDYKEETQPLEQIFVPLLDKKLFKSRTKFLKKFVNFVSSMKDFKGYDKTKFGAIYGPNNTFNVISFDQGYIHFNSNEKIKEYPHFDFSTEL